MDVHLRLTGRGDLSEQIYRQLLEAIVDGRLRSGERLPPTRVLAARLEISRNTVGVAYERLTAEGVLVGRVGAGSFVAMDVARVLPGRRAPQGAVQPLALWNALAPLIEPAKPAFYDFSVGAPDPKLFPYSTWRRFISSELRPSQARRNAYEGPGGHEGLREAIARHVGASRAVRANASDVIVTQGAQQAFNLIARVLLTRGDSVAVEEPGYPLARRLFESLGLRVHGVAVDAEGLDVSALPAAARLVYVTPSHQFPLGMPMSFPRRQALLAWAERRGAVIVEDDYDSEFRFAGRPLDPLQSLDRTGRVIYVGSFSKVLLPALRMGFLIAPASLQNALLAARQLTDWHGDPTAQGALARLIDEGLLARHIRRVTRIYAERHALIAQIVDEHFKETLVRVPSAAGLHLAARLRPEMRLSASEIVERASRLGVRLEASNGYAEPNVTREFIAIGFGRIEASRIREGMKRLAACFSGTPRTLRG